MIFVIPTDRKMGFMIRLLSRLLTIPMMSICLGMMSIAVVVTTDPTVTVVETPTTPRTAIQSHMMASVPRSALEQRPWEVDILTCPTLSVPPDADKDTTMAVTSMTTVPFRPHQLER
jgi:hypothetical protein